MAEQHPEDLKNSGNEAFKAGNYRQAITLYSQAIDLDKYNHVYYGNRASAYLKLGDAEKALADANSSISNKLDYAKAYNLKGASLQALGRKKDAVEAYKEALRLDSSNAVAKDNLAALEAEMSGRSPASSTTRRAPAASSAARAGSSSVPNVGIGNQGHPKLKEWIALGRRAILGLSVVYLLPLGFSSSAYFMLMVAATAVHAAIVISNIGMPKKSMEYGRDLMEQYFAPHIFLPLILYAGQPSIIGVLAAVPFDLLAALQDVAETIPAATGPLKQAGNSALSYVTGRPAPELQAMSATAHSNLVKQQLAFFSASSELFLLINSLILLLTPARSLLQAFLLIQLVQLKFTISRDTQQACAALHQKLSSLTQHRLCPPVVGKGYTWVARQLRSRVSTMEELEARAREQASRGNAEGGAAAGGSSCTIM